MSDALRRLMQAKLDGELSEEMIEELYDILEENADAAREYARLESIDHMLNTTPHIRAPQRLAVTIMARLAQSIEAEAEQYNMPEEIRQALMLSVSVVVITMMPTMVAASYLVVNGLRDPQLLHRATAQVIAMLVLLIDALKILLEEIEAIVHQDPQKATMAMALIPIVLMGMLEAIQRETDQYPDLLSLE